MQLLNLVYDLDLKDLNDEQRNFPAVDLGDDGAKIAFQVTSAVNEDKVQATLDKFSAHGLNARFSQGVRFLSLSHKEVRLSKKLCAAHPQFNPDKHIVTPRILIQKVKECSAGDNARLLRILDVLERSVLETPAASPDHTTSSSSGNRAMPEVLREHLLARVIGRIKLKIYEEIAGRADQLPDAAAVKQFVLDHYHRNPAIGMLYKDLLGVGAISVFDETSLTDPDDLSGALVNLEVNPIQAPTFLELADDSNDPRRDDVGILVHREPLAYGGWIYVVTTLVTERFPYALGGRVEIRASKAHPEPAVCVLTKKGWVSYSRDNYTNSGVAQFAVRILAYVNRVRTDEFQFVELKDWENLTVDLSDGWEPPSDPEFDRLIRLALRNQIRCTRINVPLALVRPHDLDFGLSYPLDVVDAIKDLIRRGNHPRLLLYWNRNKFVTSDDYACYLAYRAARKPTVPAVVMGAFPRSVARAIGSGFSELIPPIMVRKVPNYKELEPELKMFLLDQRLSSR